MTTWNREASPYSLWDLQTGSTQRITEARQLRITEQGIIRITRRARDTAWSAQPVPHTTWSDADA